MNILLVNQNSALNLGDRAIHAETLRMVAQAFPAARVTLTFHETAPAREAFRAYPILESIDSWALRVDAQGRPVITPLARRVALLALTLVGVLCYRLLGAVPHLFTDPRKQELFEAYAAADLVLACGGGYLYDTEVQTGRLRQIISFFSWSVFLLGGFLLPILLGKPLVLLPQSIGPLRDEVRRAATRWIIRRAALTFVRERRSLALLEELGCAERALAAPDMAFGLPSAPEGHARALLQRAGLHALDPAFTVGVTALDWGGQDPTFDGQEAYEHALLACVDAITSQGGAVVLFAQCISPVPAWDDRIINVRLRAAAHHPERVLVVNELLPPELLQAAYGQMDAFIGTRMHSVILATNSGVPALAIGYLHKSRGMMGEFGSQDRCLDIGSVTGGELVAALGQLREEGVRPQAGAYVERAKRLRPAISALMRYATRQG
ncbi:MAG: hypothetical protein RLZZ387_5181 [Chloroflexota bacterium]|jgi:colanic acid/amylovoran biosynthesis protein